MKEWIANRTKFAHDILRYVAENVDNHEDSEGQDFFNAYITAILLYAALSQVAVFFKNTKLYCESENESEQKILAHINDIFNRNPLLLSQVYINEAIYSDVLIYKVRTNLAVLEEANGNHISLLRQNAIADLKVINKFSWMHHYRDDGKSFGYFIRQEDNTFYAIESDQAIYITDNQPFDIGKLSISQLVLHNCIVDKDLRRSIQGYFMNPKTVNDIISSPSESITTKELMEYKNAFELMWLGHTAEDVNFEFDSEIVEKISMIVGIDREIIWIPEGSSNERKKIMRNRTYMDAITPNALRYLNALNYMGLPLDMVMHINIPDGADKQSSRLVVV